MVGTIPEQWSTEWIPEYDIEEESNTVILAESSQQSDYSLTDTITSDKLFGFKVKYDK